jgi:hypothetical protein
MCYYLLVCCDTLRCLRGLLISFGILTSCGCNYHGSNNTAGVVCCRGCYHGLHVLRGHYRVLLGGFRGRRGLYLLRFVLDTGLGG